MNASTGPKSYNIYYDNTGGYVRMDWSGYATQDEFREGTEYMLKVLVENNATKVLADLTNMVLIGKDDQNYVQYNFVPRAKERGFQVIALVKPTNYFNAIAIESMSSRIKDLRVQMRVFDDLPTAQTWLKSIDV